MNVNASLPSRRCACFLPSPPDSPPMSEKPPTSSEDFHYSAGLTLPPYPGGTSQQVRNRPQGSIYGGTRPGNDSGMDSYTQGGYQHSPSREPASGRTNLVQASSAGERGNHRTHLLSPASASGFSWDTGIGTRYEPSASGSPAFLIHTRTDLDKGRTTVRGRRRTRFSAFRRGRHHGGD